MSELAVFHLARIRLPIAKPRLLLLFVAVNFLFTGIDVTLAHAVNAFHPAYELIPIVFAPLGAVSCLLVALKPGPGRLVSLTHVVLMLAGVAVGVVGTAFHANEALNPVGRLTWIWLTFASPILAPLSFAGISLVGLYAVVRESPGEAGVLNVPGIGTFRAPLSLDRHFLWLVGLGFGACALTSIIDHGQYGYTLYKLIPIACGLFATSVVITLAVSRTWTRGDDVTYAWTMLASMAVGALGFAFHLSGDLGETGRLSVERILVFAPVLAPLLFCDLGMLGLIVVAKEAEGPRI
jgi:hypothetical protein